MLSVEGILNLLNDGTRREMPFLCKWRDVYYGMSLHIDGACPAFQYLRTDSESPIWVYPKNWFGWEYQRLFEVFHFNNFPTEPEITRQWRFSQYKPFTQDPMHRCIQTVIGSIFQDSGYSITVENKDDNEYIWGENFDKNKNLVGYFQDKFQNICNDPNGFFLTIPKEPHYATTTQKIEPHIYFIPSKNILHVTKDEIIFDGWDEYTWAVNGIGYFRFIKQENKYIHVDEAYGGYYMHLIGRMPLMIAGGMWNTQGFYDSWLTAAKSIADEYIAAFSGEQLVMKDASHPYTIMASTDCPDCTHGERQICTSCSADSRDCRCDVSHENGNYLSLIKCVSCGGTGEKSRNPADRLIAPVEDLDKKLIQIVSHDTSINKLHIERNDKIFDALMRALHLNYIDEAQSGKAKEMDMQTRYQFILKISNDLFDRLIYGAIKDILSLRNVRVDNGNIRPDDKQPFNIQKPVQFQIKTTYDLLQDYKEGSGILPPYMLTELLEDFGDKQFGGKDVLQRKMKIIHQMDVLVVMKDADISIAVLNGASTLREWQFHLQLPKILDTIIRERGEDWFIRANYTEIETEVNAMFAKIKPPIPAIQPDVISETRLT